MEALFTSLVGGGQLRRRIHELIVEATSLADSKKIDLHVMMFAFTDAEAAFLLAEAAALHPSMTIRLIADWSQRSLARGQQVGHLERLNLPNLRVRYKKDQPYFWDAEQSKVHWSYRVSRGLLHHKTLGILVDGRPWRLVCGSFNWTATAARSYENLLIVTPDGPGSRLLMARIELEFEAMWSDSRVTLSPEEAHLHYRAIVDEFSRDSRVAPESVVGIGDSEGEHLHILDTEDCLSERHNIHANDRDDPSVAIAFSSHCPGELRGACGHANCNRMQRFILYTPYRKSKSVPLTLTNLALDTIFRAAPGETIKIAMYALSRRVPEYGALINAARRGVRLFVLLDGTVGVEVAAALKQVCQLQDLPIQVRITRKMMHQKYIVNPEAATVLTGTANMSTDASTRHSEHRIRISGDRGLSALFCSDFDTIWSRLSANLS